jgi:hypothetical protein
LLWILGWYTCERSRQRTIKTILAWLKARNAGPALLISADTPDGESIKFTVEHLPDGGLGVPHQKKRPS